MRNLILILIFTLGIQAFARMRPVPLMPFRESASETSLSEETSKKLRSQRSAMGLELGTVAFSSENGADALGLQLLAGVRASFLYPIWDSYFLKPSVGYFLRPETAGSVSVTQNLLEGGLGIHRVLTKRNGRLFHVGLNSRLDYLFSRISVNDSSQSTPAELRLRVGATSGIKFVLNQDMDFTVDVEAGTPLQKPMKTYVGVTTGLVYLFK